MGASADAGSGSGKPVGIDSLPPAARRAARELFRAKRADSVKRRLSRLEAELGALEERIDPQDLCEGAPWGSGAAKNRLMKAAAGGERAVILALAAAGWDLERGFEPKRWTAACFAASAGQAEALGVLAGAGASLGVKTARSKSGLLMLALNKPCPKAVELLLAAGLDPREASSTLGGAFSYACLAMGEGALSGGAERWADWGRSVRALLEWELSAGRALPDKAMAKAELRRQAEAPGEAGGRAGTVLGAIEAMEAQIALRGAVGPEGSGAAGSAGGAGAKPRRLRI